MSKETLNIRHELLEFKQREWESIVLLSRLLHINPFAAQQNVRAYRDMRLYQHPPEILATSNYTFDDIKSIVETGKPLFDSVYDIPVFEEAKERAAEASRLEAMAKQKAHQQQMKMRRDTLARHLKNEGSTLLIHELDDHMVSILLDGYESKQSKK